MKVYIQTILFCLLAAALIYGGGRLYYRLTDGFTMSRVSLSLPDNREWEMAPLTQEEKRELEQALRQPYQYLDKGHQAYVFESQDGQFVLKLLKFQRVRVPDWLRNSSLPFSLEEWRVKRIEKKDRMLQSLLRSWKLSFEALKEEAAIVYVHINKTDDLPEKLILKDKIGLTHELELNRAIYLIQKKAPLLAPTLDHWMAEGRVQEAKELLDRLLALFISEYQRGLAEKDLFILRNTGVLEGRPIHIDTGRFEWDQTLKEAENYKQELRRKTVKLLQWLEQHHPELATYFAKRVHEAV